MRTRRTRTLPHNLPKQKGQPPFVVSVTEDTFTLFTKLQESTGLNPDGLLRLLIEVYNNTNGQSRRHAKKSEVKQQISKQREKVSERQSHQTKTRRSKTKQQLENNASNPKEVRMGTAAAEGNAIAIDKSTGIYMDDNNETVSNNLELCTEEKPLPPAIKRRNDTKDTANVPEISEESKDRGSHEHQQSQIALVLLSMSQAPEKGEHNQDLTENSVTEFPQKYVPASTNGDNAEENEDSVENRNQEAHLSKQTISKVQKQFSCDQCDYKTIKKSDLKTHVRIHTGVRPYPCSQCKASFRQRHHLHYHELTHSNTSNFTCSHCPKSFRTTSKLRLHLKTHKLTSTSTEVQNIFFKCSQCDYKTSTASELRKHSNTHSTEKNFKCEFCEFTTSWKKNLRIHRMRHTGEKPYSCQDCAYATYDSHALRRHKVQTHCKEQPYVCEVCGSGFSQRKLLNQHQVVHTGEKPYKCPHCEYRAGYRSNLRSHLLMHNPKKGFVCDQCGQAFRQKQHLSGHQKNKHSNPNKVYHCKLCEYKTTSSQSINSHMRIHNVKNKKVKTVISNAGPKESDQPIDIQMTTDLSGQTTANPEHFKSDNPSKEHGYSTHSIEENSECAILPPFTSSNQSASYNYSLETDQNHAEGNHLTQSLPTLTSGSQALPEEMCENSGMSELPHQNLGAQNPIITLENHGEECGDTSIEPVVYDQQSGSLFQYERMAAVLGNMIPDFSYQS